MSLAELIRQKQRQIIFESHQSIQQQEYKSTLKRYAESLSNVLIGAGLTHEETSVITSAVKGENFDLCQHLLLIAYKNRTETPENCVHRLYSLAMDISIVSRYKQTFI